MASNPTAPSLNTPAALTRLEDWLSTRSYIQGYSYTDADNTCFGGIVGSPSPKEYPHIYRWHKLIKDIRHENDVPVAEIPKEDVEFYKIANISANAPATPPANAADSDDDLGLFDEDDEEEEARKKDIEARRQATKKPKPGKIAKSYVVLHVKPWDDETDMKELEANVRKIQMDGLAWGASKMVPVGYGINMLEIHMVVEDEKVSIDTLQELIAEDEDHVQSSDISAMQKHS